MLGLGSWRLAGRRPLASPPTLAGRTAEGHWPTAEQFPLGAVCWRSGRIAWKVQQPLSLPECAVPSSYRVRRGSSRRVPWPGLKRDNRGHTCILVRSCLEEAGLSISALPWRTCEDGSVTVGVCPLPGGVASTVVPPQGSTSLRTEGLETDGRVFSCSLFEFRNKSITLKVRNGSETRAILAATWEVGQLSVTTEGKAGHAGRALGGSGGAWCPGRCLPGLCSPALFPTSTQTFLPQIHVQCPVCTRHCAGPWGDTRSWTGPSRSSGEMTDV